MKIFMAGGAGLRKADEAAIQILFFNQGAFARRNALRGVALLAFDARVLSFKHVARLFMIKGFRVPFDQLKINAVVVGVALDTFLTGSGA